MLACCTSGFAAKTSRLATSTKPGPYYNVFDAVGGEELQVKFSEASIQVIDGRPVGTRTPDLYRVKVAMLGFTTYKTAGTAKVRGSHIRHTFCGLGCGLQIITGVTITCVSSPL